MKRLYLITCLLLLCACAHAQNAWSKIYDFCPDPDRASENVVHFADNDLIIGAGHTKTNGISTYHSYITAIDYSGNILHSKNLYSPGISNMIVPGYFAEVKGNPLAKVSENKYVLAGVENDNKASKRVVVFQPFFYFFDKNCDSILQVKYKDTLISYLPLSVLVDNKKNIVVSGYQTSQSLYYDSWDNSYNWDSFYIWVAKYDSNANQIWSHKYMPAYRTGIESYKIIQSHDKSSYIISGIDANAGFIMKIDLSGNVVWKTPMHGKPDIIPTSDNKYAFVSSFFNSSANELTPYYGKFDDLGDTLWTKKFKHHKSNDVVGKFIVEAENQDLVILSYIFQLDSNEVIRTTPQGNIKWYREYAFIDTTYLINTVSHMTYTPTRQVLLSGMFYSVLAVPGVFDTVGKYSWFVLTDTFGCIEPGCQVGDTVWWLTDVNEIAARPVDITLYPNPATNTVYIQAGTTLKKLKAVLRDMSGRTLRTTPLQSNGTRPEASGKTPVNIATLPQGLYMLEVWDDLGRVKVFKVNKVD